MLLGGCYQHDGPGHAGLSVLALVNTHSAAAIQYGYDRDFQAGEQTVLLLDVGASSTEAALVRFSTFNSTAARTYGYAALLRLRMPGRCNGPTYRACPHPCMLPALAVCAHAWKLQSSPLQSLPTDVQAASFGCVYACMDAATTHPTGCVQ